MFLRPREEAGEEGWARPNISAVGGIATQNGTWGALAGDASRWRDGRLRTLVGGGTGQINLDLYGLGLDRPSFDQKVRYSLEFTAAVAQANWAARSQVTVGGRDTLRLRRRGSEAARRTGVSRPCRSCPREDFGADRRCRILKERRDQRFKCIHIPRG